MRRAFVCGHPIGHSRSPNIHAHWLREYEIVGRYDPIDVPAEAFPGFAQSLRDGAFVGGNVTLPNKEIAYGLVDRLDEPATAIGAVNTLWMEGTTLFGGNTDAFGFAANLDEHAPGWTESPGTAIVLGAGGAARAVLHALRLRGFQSVRIVNRTPDRAEALAGAFGSAFSAHGWGDLDTLLPEAGLVVNTTSLGMHGQAAGRVDLARLPGHALVTDIVYVPLETPLLAAARARNLRTIDGLGMLLHQAVPGFERWFGVRPEVTAALRAEVVADLTGRT